MAERRAGAGTVLLSSQQRAELFLGLARYAEAGMPYADALRHLAGRTPACAHALAGTRRLVAAGQALSTAGRSSGLFLAWEAPLLQAAERAGSLPRVMSSLAARHERHAADRRLLKARLAYPLALLALALFIVPLPALVGGRISAGGYLSRSAGVLLLAALAVRLVKHWWQLRQHRPGSPALAAAELRLPLVGRHAHLRAQLDYLDTLQLGIAAGLPIADAARNAAAGVGNAILRDACARVATRLAEGDALGQALTAESILEAPLVTLIDTAETAGRLDSALAGIVAQLRERQRLWHKNLTDWLPRIVYFLVLAALAISLL